MQGIEHTIEQTKERYLRSPRLRAKAGGAILRVLSWEPEGERVLRFSLGLDGAPEGPPVAGPWSEGIVAWGRDEVPSSDEGEELRAYDGDAELWIEQGRGLSEVWMRLGERAPVLVFRAPGIAAAPAVARTKGGAWAAFHHDVREDTLKSDVAKWIALRFVREGGEVLEPASGMPGRDRDLDGEEQSFEFPALLVGPGGALMLVGRGSHNFWRQDFSSEGASERIGLSDGQWGSRGRRPSLALLEDGAALVAVREKKGIRLLRLDPPEGGPPALIPTERDLAPARSELRGGELAGDRPPIFFGDIQQHSAHSDGTGTAEEAYLRARDRYGDDFVALTDHESFLGKRTGPGEWRYLQRVADRFEEPGTFATLVAYEWTGRMFPGPGHKCVYFPDSGYPLVSRDVLPNGGDLVRQIRTLGGFASPHHIGWTGADEEGHDPIGQPLWEICSCHGCYEHKDHPLGQRGENHDQLVDVMLKKGHRFGFTASSDAHGLLWHHGTARKRDPYRTGLTGVHAPTLSRRSLFEALRARSCYATSGVKIRLSLSAGGAQMGSELSVPGSIPFHVHAVGAGPLSSIQLIGPEGVIAELGIEGKEGRLVAQAFAPYVYARVIQEDGEMAWSSPVFLDRSAEAIRT